LRVAKIKGLICLVAVLAVISTTVIIATDSEIEQSENQSKESTVIVTTQLTTEVTTTKKVEETTEEIIEVTTEQVTEKPTEVTTVKPTATVKPTTKPVETTKSKETEAQIEKSETSEALYSASKFMNMGVIYWNGWRWTWYSERVLPGSGLNIPGRHADSSGYICDGNDYICLSSSSLSKGTVIATPFGKSGKVYDTGCASDTIDIYVNW
jgi:hypothetical protein